MDSRTGPTDDGDHALQTLTMASPHIEVCMNDVLSRRGDLGNLLVDEIDQPTPGAHRSPVVPLASCAQLAHHLARV